MTDKAATLTFPPPAKKAKTARMPMQQKSMSPWIKPEQHPYYQDLTDMLGGSGEMALLWYDTATKWYSP